VDRDQWDFVSAARVESSAQPFVTRADALGGAGELLRGCDEATRSPWLPELLTIMTGMVSSPKCQRQVLGPRFGQLKVPTL
jgi:hypothetical protein